MAEPPQIYRAVEMEEGAGARVRRLFPVAGLRHLDPFVLLDEFFLGAAAGFPDHPHRGFEAITYLLSGGLHHRDNLGNDCVMEAGGALVFTAGSGIVHSEMPVGAATHGLQLWVNLAGADKGVPAALQQADAGHLPLQTLPYGRLCTVIGPGSPIRLHTPVSYHDVQLEQEGEFHLAVPDAHQGLLYVVSGRPEVAGTELAPGTALALAAGAVLAVHAERPCRFISLDGLPHGEPILQHGSFVD